MSMRVCGQPGCGTLIPAPGFCFTHRRARNKARGSRQARGYDAEHDRLRRDWSPKVATGTIACAKCHLLIPTGTQWDLGHTDDRTGWTGPEHARCNRQAAGRASQRLT